MENVLKVTRQTPRRKPKSTDERLDALERDVRALKNRLDKTPPR